MKITNKLLVLNSRISIYLLKHSLEMADRSVIIHDTPNSKEKYDLVCSLKDVLKEINND